MWIEQTPNGKVKYREKYKDPYTGKWASPVSVTFEKDSKKNRVLAEEILREKIAKKTNQLSNKKITFSQLYEEWFRYYEKTVRRNTVLRHTFIKKKIDKVIDPEALIDKIDRKLIDKIVEDMYIFGDLSYDYTKKVVITLHQLFDFAIDKGYLSENPINRYKINVKSEDKEKQRNKQKYKYLEKNEVDKLLAYFNSKESTYWLHARATEFLYLTGMRFGEMAALQWKNFDGKSVKVNGTLDYRNRKNSEVAKFNATKTSAGNRTVDLTDRLISILDEIKSAQILMFKKIEKDNFIFRNSDGFPISIYTLNKALKSAAAHQEIDKVVTSHIFRHTHVSLLAEMNLPLKSIMERIGHSDASTTLKIYNHVTKKAKQDVLDALNKI